LFQKSKKFRISEFSWVIRSSFRSSEVLMGFQKFRSSEVEKFSWGIKSSDVQEFHKFHIFRSSQKFRSSGVQEFHKFTTSWWAKLFIPRAMST